jgi:hypothetical protein
MEDRIDEFLRNLGITPEMETLLKNQDLAGIMKYASDQLKAQKAAEKELLEKNQGALADLTKALMAEIEATITSYFEKAKELVGDKAAISVYMDKEVWKASVCKSAAKAKKEGVTTAPAGKFELTTAQLLELHGDEISNPQTDVPALQQEPFLTWTEAWEAAKLDDDKKNATYQVRVRLIKFHNSQASA